MRRILLSCSCSRNLLILRSKTSLVLGLSLEKRFKTTPNPVMVTVTMKRVIATLAFGLLSSDGNAQQNQNQYEPYTPIVVGLPPGSQGIEQPVYVADRAISRPGMETVDGTAADFLSANSLGFDETKVVPSLSKMDRFEAGMLIAVVGEEPVLVGNLIPPSKLTPKIVEHSQFEMQLRKELLERVTSKALAHGFLNNKVSGKPNKDREDAKRQMKSQTAKIFHEKWIPEQMKRFKCESPLEFDQKLIEAGKTISSMLDDWTENVWAQEYVNQKVTENPIIELSELNDYYQEHIDDFKKPSRVRFQMLSANFSKFPTKQAAFEAIADMGNQVLFGGAPFAAVAKRQSTGFGASEGGLFDWTTQGALKSKEIDKAIFENPVRGLSQVIETSDGYHIVEVLEREQACTQTFAQSQAEIRKKLTEQKVSKQRSDFIKKVRAETPIWTKWPEDIPGSLDVSLLQE